MKEHHSTTQGQTRKIFLLFSHSFSTHQTAWAESNFGPCRPVEMPGSLKKIWQQIPADKKELFSCLDPFRKWLKEQGNDQDLVLVQGDFGATYLMINYAFKINLVPIYATTIRKARETLLPDGTVILEHEFRFCRFRKYGE